MIVPVVDASAVLNDDGSVTIFALNRDMEEDAELSCDLRAFEGLKVAEHIVLHNDDVKAVNTETDPDRVKPTQGEAGTLDEGKYTVVLPKLSWNVIRLTK